MILQEMDMRKEKKVEKKAIETINLLEVKLNEVNQMIRSHSTQEDEKKLDRLKVAIKNNIETVRRAMLDNGIPKVIR